MPTHRVEIDLGAIGRNCRRLSGIIGPAARLGVCAVLKHDGYGAGAVRVARALEGGVGRRDLGSAGAARAGGVWGGAGLVAVYSPDEARHLAEAGLAAGVLVLMPVATLDRLDPLYRLMALGGGERLHLAAHDGAQVASLSRAASRLGVRLPVHIHVDTGMSRGGAMPDEAERLVGRVVDDPRLRLAGVMTHFSSSAMDGALTAHQAGVMRGWWDRVSTRLAASGIAPASVALHMADSAGALRSAAYHGDMVRVGQALFGYGIESMVRSGGAGGADAVEFEDEAAALEPAVRWVSRVVHVSEIPAGWPVGYGATWHAPQREREAADGRGGSKTRIALVPVGYADGYPRSLSSKGVVRLTGEMWSNTPPAAVSRGADNNDPAGAGSGGGGGALARVVGRVSMDQITVDVTGLDERLWRVGAEVELVGACRGAANSMPVVAQSAGTIVHDLMCQVGLRGTRMYVTSGGGAAAAPAVVRPVRRAAGAR